MKRKTETRDIAGVTIRTTQIPVMRAIELLPRVVQIDELKMTEGPALLAIFVDILAHTSVITEDEETGKKSQIDLSEKGAINRAFSSFRQVNEVVKFVVEFNYADFSDAPSTTNPPSPSE